jgi:hypothetical protein
MQASKISREILCKYGGPSIYVDMLDRDDEYNNPQILESIVSWLQYDNQRVEHIILQDLNLDKIIEVNTQNAKKKCVLDFHECKILLFFNYQYFQQNDKNFR